MIQLILISLLSLTNTSADETRIDKVESEVRRFRIHAYENYRQDREEYDRRISAGKALWEKWETAKHPLSSAEPIEKWFAEAREVEANGEFPPAPRIELVQLDEPSEFLSLNPDAPEGIESTELPPTVDPVTDNEELSISRVDDEQVLLSSPELTTEFDGFEAPPWTPTSWRSLGRAVLVGVEASFEQPTQ